MRRYIIVFLCALGLLLGAKSSLAANYAVGSCRPSLPSYPTISQAVATVPPGSTVKVCPGTYSEQVTISTPLTLEGITNGNSDRAIITVPSSGLLTFGSIFGVSVAPQILVTTGPVNITNITVDGTGNNLAGSAYLAGIFYFSGASGTVSQVTTRQQLDNSEGVGIWVENGNTTTDTVTIENSSVHDFDFDGILVGSNQPSPTLNATVKGNDVTAGEFGIAIVGADAAITGNTVTGMAYGGISINSGGTVSVVGNTVALSDAFGIEVLGATTTLKSNTVTNSGTFGIFLDAPGATIQSNTIAKHPTGIEFQCNTATVSGNTITDATTGLNDVPLSLTPGVNTFENVDTIRSGGGCTSISLAARKAMKSGIPQPR